MRLRDSFDIPEEVAQGPHSPAFGEFLWNWFGDTYRLTHGELDLAFLEDLTPDELTLAREMVRRNLKLTQNHIIEGASALHDVDAAPILRAMLNDEASLSRQLTIAGALWKLTQDPIFVEVLHRARASGERLFTGTHLLQVLWLPGPLLLQMRSRSNYDVRGRRDTAAQPVGSWSQYAARSLASAFLLQGPQE